MRVRLTDNPNLFVDVTELEYYELVRDNKVIPPWGGLDSITKKWPDFSGHYITPPDVGRGPRFPFLRTNEEAADAEGSSDD